MTVCGHCGQENPAAARFCLGCGSALVHEREPGREVRKTVTVLFCDVVGSTALGEKSDPEVLRGVMSRFYAAARAPVERHGGRLEKVIGDAVVAVFGIPAVHEDDALRALRAALEIRDAVTAMGEVQARIGVNTGDVLAAEAHLGESLVVGDAVNIAARLEQAAPAGAVLVGEATWALASHAAAGTPVAPVVAKGKSEPLAAWRLESVDPAAAGHRRRLDLPMVGRGTELGLVQLVARRAQTLERPHMVTLMGQPGIGKSRLVAELARLDGGFTVLTGNCRATAASSLMQPLLEVTQALSVAELMPDDPQAGAVASCLEPDGDAGAQDVAWAASRLIGAASAARPVVVVLEDVHWADDLLLDVVEQLTDRVRRRTLLVVCTARPEFGERRPGWGGSANALSLSLERLDDEQTQELLRNANPALAADQAAAVIAAAEGNPLFAEHLAALVGDHDLTAGVPRSLQVLLSARLEALPAPEREVVSVAAVAGREFKVASVQSVIGRPIDAELDRLAGRELIEGATDGRRQFVHALLHEAAYGLLPKQRRSELHVQLAALMQSAGASDAAVGDHLALAYELRKGLGMGGDETVRIGAEAGARLAAAGRRADALGDPRRARRLLEQALALLPADSPERASASVELAAAGWNLLSRAEVVRLLEAGEALAARLGLRAVELRAHILHLGSGDNATLTEAAILAETDAAVIELERLDAPRALATALVTRAESELFLGSSGDAVASARRAVADLRAIDEDSVWALAALVSSLIQSPVPVGEAEAILAGLMDDLGKRPTARIELLRGQSMLALLRGAGGVAAALLDSAHEIERDLGRNVRWQLVETGCQIAVRTGRYPQARDMLEGFAVEMDRRGAPSDGAVARAWLALAEVRLGNLAAAEATAGAALQFSERTRLHEGLVRARLAQAEIDLARGRAAAAAETAEDACAIADTGDWALLRADARLTYAWVLAASGDPRAEEQARIAESLCKAKGYVRAAG